MSISHRFTVIYSDYLGTNEMSQIHAIVILMIYIMAVQMLPIR